MDEGFIIDETHGTMKSQKWVLGAPEYSFWFGLKLRGKKPLDVSTYRCGRCGLLESHAGG